jgi:hypothetical protein
LFIQVTDQLDPTAGQRLARNVVDVDVEGLADALQNRVMN